MGTVGSWGTLVKTLENVRVTKAVAGKSHTLFLTSGGEVWACGSNEYGRRNGGKTGGKSVPRRCVVKYFSA